MKSLKLEHELAQEVEKGVKAVTWRLYDDKDLTVNDNVQLIDKVDPTNPATWRVIGVARIDSIIQKRLGDVAAEDYDGQEKFPDVPTILETYRKYYGQQVDIQTPVKIIRFTLNNSTETTTEVTSIDAKNATELTEVELYCDGGSRGNPGPSASGFVLMDMEGHAVVKKGMYLGITTNNQAEYQALKFGLDEAKKVGARDVHVYLDSLLVVNQMLGIFKIKNRDLWPIHSTIKELVATFRHVSFTHVPRELNKIADAAVNEALDAAEKLQ